MFISELFLDEISDEALQRYLQGAGKVVDRRMDRMARVRDRLNKGYEIYHADRPANGKAIVDRFEADTPALARQYYEKFIHNYESDVDFDLQLRRATGIIEGEGGLNQTAGIGINGKQFNFSIQDLIAKAQNYPIKKLNPQLFVKQLADRHEDPKQTAARAQTADLQYPIIVVQDGNTLMIADGTHRAQKAIMNKLPAINARIIPSADMVEFSKQGVNEAVNPMRQQAGQMIDKYFGQIYEYGDSGLDYLDNHAPIWFKLFDQYRGDIDVIIATAPVNLLVKSAQELKNVASDLGYELSEVTKVPTVAKSKRQHLDVMPNDGKPILRGEEENYLGKFVSKMPGGYELWGWSSRWDRTYFVFDPETRISQLATTGKQYPENPNSFVVVGVYSGPKNQVRAADLYAFLIRHIGLTLVSDNKQSEGGYRVWQELERRYGKTINVHGFDTRTDKGVNVTTRDEPDTHVDRADVKKAGPQMKKELGSISRDLRFVASAK
jgi:hypothetical protein